MKTLVAMMAVVATAGLLAACQPGKPISTTAGEGHYSSAEKTDTTSRTAPAPADKSGRTFEAQ